MFTAAFLREALSSGKLSTEDVAVVATVHGSMDPARREAELASVMESDTIQASQPDELDEVYDSELDLWLEAPRQSFGPRLRILVAQMAAAEAWTWTTQRSSTSVMVCYAGFSNLYACADG